MKYHEFMTPQESLALLEEVRSLDEAYRQMDEFFDEFDEGDAEDWTDKERQAMLP